MFSEKEQKLFVIIGSIFEKNTPIKALVARGKKSESIWSIHMFSRSPSEIPSASQENKRAFYSGPTFL